jgi:hypothetical protein
MTETKEITIKEELLPIISKIDNIVTECMPAAITHSKSIRDALILAKGVSELRKIFVENGAIKATIEAMKDNPLGFLTDRSPNAIEDAKKKGKKLEPYTYDEVVDCVIEGLFNGYRITGKEMYIIAGNFYGGQKGKHRKIIETASVSDFNFSTALPTPAQKMGNNEYSEVTAWAKWRINGVEKSVGIDNPLIFRIKVNFGMSEDAIIGKALSKLFSRVLYHITGQLVQDEPEIIDITPKTKEIKPGKNPLLDKIQSSQPQPQQSQIDPVDEIIKNDWGGEFEICAYCGIDKLNELTDEHFKNLGVIVNSIKSKKMTKEEFWAIAAQRMKEKNEGILIGSEK